MSFKSILLKLLIFVLSLPLVLLLAYLIFSPILSAKSLIFPYTLYPFDIVSKYPDTWKKLKASYFICLSISYSILYLNISHKFKFDLKSSTSSIKNTFKTDLNLLIGLNEGVPTYISESGLYQNILITGTIGTGKTSSAMYPFTEQLLNYKCDSAREKLSMLILDVKGNYLNAVVKFAENSNRLKDLIVIDLSGNVRYNPLDKQNLSPIVLANRLKTILTLFSPNTSESYWLDKAEQVLSESIKFCRLYNNNYVSFAEIHKLIMFPEYYSQKLSIIKNLFKTGAFSNEDSYNLLSCIEFFEKEFFSLDSRTLSILKSEISRMTNIFVSDYKVSKVFCPPKSDVNFKGFKDVLEKGKIVVLNMNIAEYKNLSKIIATYLKLDFQTEVLSRLGSNGTIRKNAFICDEFQEYITTTDADFLSQAREAKCINIIATQSYSSLRNALKDDMASKVIIQNIINKIWFRTDDIYTIEESQKLLGKEEKEKFSTTISENARETTRNFLTNTLISQNSNLSESYNKYTQNDYKYDTNYFSQSLKTFKSLSFLSDGFKILEPVELQMIPYYEKEKYMKGLKTKWKIKN